MIHSGYALWVFKRRGITGSVADGARLQMPAALLVFWTRRNNNDSEIYIITDEYFYL